MDTPEPGAPDVVIRGVRAVDRLRASDTCGPEAEQHLEALPVEVRFVVLAIVGPGRPDGVAPGQQADLEEEARYRSAVLEDPDLRRALLQGMSVVDDLPGLWERIILPLAPLGSSDGVDLLDDTMVAAQTLAVAGALPPSVADPADVQRVPTPRAQSVFGMGLGWLARRKHPTAEHLLLGLLAARQTPPRLRISLVRGLGAGKLDDGFAWLADRVDRALRDRQTWVEAAREASYWAISSGWPAAEKLVRAVWRTIESVDDGLDHLVRWSHLAGEREAEFDRLVWELIEEWTWWPAPARASLLRFDPDAVMDVPERWTGDMSPVVILAGLELAGECGVSTTAPALSWVQHPAMQVRQAAYEHLRQAQRAEPLVIADEPEEPSVVSFPTNVLARTPLDRLRIALASDEPESVVELTGELNDDEHAAACEELFIALRVPDMAMRRAAIAALGLIGSADQVGDLMESARTLAGLEGSILESMERLGDGSLDVVDVSELVTFMDRRLRWADDEAVDVFVNVTEGEALEPLIHALATPFYPPARLGAARALGRHGMSAGVFALRLRALTDRDPEVRQACLESLGMLSTAVVTGREMAGYGLSTAGTDELEEAELAAINAGEAALPGLRATMEHGTWRIRAAACRVLGALRGPEAETALLDALLDTDEDVRLAAQGALAARGWVPVDGTEATLSAMAQRRLQRLVDNPAYLDLETLVLGLSMGGHLFRAEVLEALETVEGRDQEAASRPRDAHERAARCVARLDSGGALEIDGGIDVLLEAVDRTWQRVPFRSALVAGLRELPVPELAQAAARVPIGWRGREALCEALRRSGADEAVPLLAEWLLDPVVEVRLAAFEALLAVGTEHAANGLRRATESPFQDDADTIGDALAAMGDVAMAAIDLLAQSPWWEARRVAAIALAKWRGDLRMAVDRLLPMGVDPEYRVAEVAHRALRAIGVRPSVQGEINTVCVAQDLSVSYVLPWLRRLDGDHPQRGEVLEAWRSHLESLPDGALVHRLGVLSTLGAEGLLEWVREQSAAYRDRHLGVCVAASRCAETLLQQACHLCQGDRVLDVGTAEFVRCPGCSGRGTA